MIRHAIVLITALALAPWAFADEPPTASDEIRSEIQKTPAGERILFQEVLLDAPVQTVWDAYTTSDGWQGWAAPVAEVDLRVGGSIRTNYNPEGKLGDESTNNLTIVNYVPRVVLTLKAELSKNWPEIMKKDADNLTNVILFDELGPERTRVRSYGIGYQDAPEYDALMTFFIKANEGLYRKLAEYVKREPEE